MRQAAPQLSGSSGGFSAIANYHRKKLNSLTGLMVMPCTRCTWLIAMTLLPMVAKKIIEVGATVRDPEEVCKLAVEQLGRPN
jgi:hypothetical protein